MAMKKISPEKNWIFIKAQNSVKNNFMICVRTESVGDVETENKQLNT